MDFMIRAKKIGEDSKIPKLFTDGSSGYDIYAYRVLDRKTKEIISDLQEPAEIKPGESVLFGTGICLEIPETHHAVVASRSGLASEYDIEVGDPGAPIDSDYRGEITILLRNFGKESFMVSKGMRIAQMVFQSRMTASLVEVKELSKTERGGKARGSTGLY